MRNWPKTLLPASYRGVSFQVSEEGLADSGRRVAVHEFVKAEDHATEDMGRKVRRWKVSAYVAGDTADTDALALVEACSTDGVGTLILPFSGSLQVRCTECSTTGSKDQLGTIKIEMSFVEAGGTSTVQATAIGDRIAASSLATLPALISSALSAFGQ
ncbi:DNA circularisation protein N-terminus [Faunimonas pinastri]|uniref:DNA circularisation protein N-terminus n=1 Tax=Faunimonas pinastri TaxID=1855383 RepID=A0A1H9GEF7_9HYPH|nr:DNA circularization N-terminal domain-containing protein [Faunimonas pinastri]SEQ48444.1 DNA circularisation protein N-terminus [Faunimonas pinastri]